MNPLSRRAIMKLIGLAPVAVPSLASSAPAFLKMAEPLMAAAAITGGLTDAELPSPPGRRSGGVENILGKAAFRRLESIHNEINHEFERGHRLAVGGIDADIACLKSTSHSWKCQQQRARNRTRLDLLTRLQQVLWQ